MIIVLSCKTKLPNSILRPANGNEMCCYQFAIYAANLRAAILYRCNVKWIGSENFNNTLRRVQASTIESFLSFFDLNRPFSQTTFSYLTKTFEGDLSAKNTEKLRFEVTV